MLVSKLSVIQTSVYIFFLNISKDNKLYYISSSDILDEELWEDDPLFYKCLDPKNEGVVMNPALGDIGDRRITSQVKIHPNIII
jgi:hypothetical protein